MALASNAWHAWRDSRMIAQEGRDDMIGQVSRWCWDCFWFRQHSEHLVFLSRERQESLYVCMNCARKTLVTLVWCEYHQGWSPANLAYVSEQRDGRPLYMCCACDDFYNGNGRDDDTDKDGY